MASSLVAWSVYAVLDTPVDALPDLSENQVSVLFRYDDAGQDKHISVTIESDEMTPDDVTECVNEATDLRHWLPAYGSACDPRLNAHQASGIAELVAELLQSHRSSGTPRGARLAAHRTPRASRTRHSPQHRREP